MLESSVQRKIIEALEKAGWITHKVIASSKPGWPDVEAFKNRRSVFIECKRPGKEADTLQRYRLKKLQEHGFEVIENADSLEHVRHLLR